MAIDNAILVTIGAETDQAQRALVELVGKLDQVKNKLREASGESKSEGGFLGGMFKRNAEAAGQHITSMIAGFASVEGAIRLGEKALEAFNRQLEQSRKIGEEAAAEITKVAGPRQAAVMEAAGTFGGFAGVDRIAASLRGVQREQAYAMINSTAKVGGGLNTGTLTSILQQTAALTNLRAVDNPAQAAAAFTRIRQLTGRGNGAQTFGFAGQFANDAAEYEGLADVLSAAGVSGDDPRAAGSLYEYFLKATGNAGGAASIGNRLLLKATFKGGVKSGTEYDITKGKVVDRTVGITGGNVFDRLDSLGSAFRNATEEQKGEILGVFGRPGTPEYAAAVRLLQDPAAVQALRERTAGAARPGSAGADRIASGLMAGLETGVGSDVASTNTGNAIDQSALLSERVLAKKAELQKGLERYIDVANLPGRIGTFSSYVNNAILKAAASNFPLPSGVGSPDIQPESGAFFNNPLGRTRGIVSYVRGQLVQQDGGESPQMLAIAEHVATLASEVVKAQAEARNVHLTLQELNETMKNLGFSLFNSSHQAPGTRAGEIP